MIDFNNIFDMFDDSEEPNDNDDLSLLMDFSEHPLYWIGGFNKIIDNHIFFSQYTVKTFKNISPELEENDLEKAGEYIMYNKAWDYIKGIDVNNAFHVECIKLKANDRLIVALVAAIKFFEDLEEYEKCALLKAIEDKSKEFLT